MGHLNVSLSNTLGTSPTSSNNSPQVLSNEEMLELEALLAQVLSELEAAVGKAGQNKSNQQTQIGQANLTEANQALQQANTALTKYNAAVEKAKHASLFEKIFSAIVGAILTIIAAVTGQVELAVLSGALLVAAETGGISKVASLLSSALEKLGMSQKDANLVANLIIVVAIIVVCVVTCNPSAGESAAARATAVAADAAAPVEEASTSVLKTVWNVVKSVAGKVQDLISSLPKGVQVGLFAASQGIQSTGLISSLAPFLEHLSSKEQAAIEGLLTTLVALMGLLTAGSFSGNTVCMTGRWARLVQQGLEKAALGFQAGSAASSMALATIELDLASAEELLSFAQAREQLFLSENKSTMSASQGDQKIFADLLSRENEALNNLLQAQTQAGAALANVLCSRG